MTRRLACAVTVALVAACSGGGGRNNQNQTTNTSLTTNGDSATAGSDSATGTAGSATSNGATGTLFDVGDASTSGGTGPTCNEVTDTAENKLQPADIIVVVDNSGSMDFEANFVQNYLNTFSNQIIQAGIEAHVAVISSYPDNGNGVCINAPLGKPGGCLENPPDDNNLPTFLHIDKKVSSNSALQDILGTEPQWNQILRPDGSLHMIVITDDDSNLSAGDFDSMLKAIDPAYGKYVFHAIASPEDPVQACLLQTSCCFQAADQGKEYETLVNMTGGVFGNLCDQDFAPVFDAVSEKVVQTAGIACEWDIPDTENFDPDKVNVQFDDGQGGILDIGRVDDPAQCPNVTDGWYYDDPLNPTKILLCPQTCEKVQGFDNAQIQIKFGCPTKPAG